MSSGFVSGGTVDAPIERSDAWLAAQTELEASRARKAAEAAQQQNGRSLFETLEANKAAKQDAFEEASRLKNQFRSLDEDEIEFLDSVLESTRAAEERVRKETEEGLEAFRRRRDEIERVAREKDADADGREDGRDAGGREEDGEWAASKSKKRRRGKIEKDGGIIKGVKIRRMSSTGPSFISSSKEKETTSPPSAAAAHAEPIPPNHPSQKSSLPKELSNPSKPVEKETEPPSSKQAPKSGLVDYASDGDDDW